VVDVLRELLSMGGDAATIALVIFMWRLDRRVYRLEILSGLKMEKRHGMAD
jgi:hypothetical protein